MSEQDELTKLARKIARDLFTPGSQTGRKKIRADRLVLRLTDGRDLGGWSEKPMADRIEKQLRKYARQP